MKANNVSTEERFSVCVLCDAEGDVVEITDTMRSALCTKYGSRRRFMFNTVEHRFEVTDRTDEEKEEVVFTGKPFATTSFLRDKLARFLDLDVPELNLAAAVNLAEVALNVTHLEIVSLEPAY